MFTTQTALPILPTITTAIKLIKDGTVDYDRPWRVVSLLNCWLGIPGYNLNRVITFILDGSTS